MIAKDVSNYTQFGYKPNFFPNCILNGANPLYNGEDTLVGRTSEIEHIGNTLRICAWDIPKQTPIRNSKLCGYITPQGKYYECGHCEHLNMIRRLILSEYLNEYLDVDWRELDGKFNGIQEEYFAMKILGWCKISSFHIDKNQMYLFYYQKLTPQQSDIVYGR